MAQNQYKIAKRLLKLIELVDAGEPISENSIKELFEVKRSCAIDYLEFVRDVRRDLEEVHLNDERVWRRQTPGQNVELTQALAFELGAIQLEAFTGTRLHRELVELSRSFRERLNPAELERLDRLTSSFYRRAAGHSGANIEVTERLIDALTHRFRCKMDYEPLGRDTQAYDIEPCRLIHYNDSLYLLARKVPEGDMRTFALDGIQRIVVDRSSRFPPPPPHELNHERLFRHSLGIHLGAGNPELVRLRVRLMAANHLQRRPLHPTQQCHEPTVDGWMEVSLTVRICPELESRILSLIPDVQIMAPAHLLAKISGRISAARVAP
jgi:predicted DNA-binding transcriptional regulator YafY